MSWNSKIYVATTNLGVYYTSNFTDPAVQPTWTAVNTGLGATTCREFWLDPFDPDNRQYVLIGTTGGLYMRVNEGNWATILTVAEVKVILTAWGITNTNAGMFSFCVDSTVAGRLWVYVGSTGGVTSHPRGYFALYSDDYGANWTLTIAYLFFYNYREGQIRAQGVTVFLNAEALSGGPMRIFYTTNKGTNWSYSGPFGLSGIQTYISMNNLLPDRIYCGTDPTGADELSKVSDAGAQTVLQNNRFIDRSDVMWYSLINSDIQRQLHGGILNRTDDEWSTMTTPAACGAISISPQAGADEDKMFVGLTPGTHTVGTLDDPTDVTVTGISGSNAGAAPFADSIPNTSGGPCYMGIQTIANVTGIFTYDVDFEAAVNDDSVHAFGIDFEAAINNDTVHVDSVVME